MTDNNNTKKLLVIPCGGVGKVQGLISREAAYHVTDKLLPNEADTVCLALLVTGDAETQQKVQQNPCVTLDGCPKLCAQKNVELSGGKIAQAVRVYDVMKQHRGANFGNATVLSDEGWATVEELAGQVAQVAEQGL